MSNLTARESEAICRCYHEFFKDSNNSNASVERVALVFQVSSRTVKRVLERKHLGQSLVQKRSVKSVVVDYSFKESLNDFIFSKIKKNEHFTIRTIFEYASENLDFTYSQSTLYKIIKSIGYRFKMVDRKKILIERPQIVHQRIKFLSKYLQYLKEYENGNLTFIYLDETWVYQNGSQTRQWCLESTSKGLPSTFKNEGKRYTIVNAGYEEGFLPGCDLILDSKVNDRDYHKTMNGDIFTKWATQQLIPALETVHKKCVVIMDNAPYHSMKTEKLPTKSSKKGDMITWLNDHNIAYNDSCTKLELWNIIQPHVEQSSLLIKYKVDEMLRAQGHEVLRLPPYNCQYNPIELAWGDCKTFYNKHICGHLAEKDRVISVWQEALQQCTKEKWKNNFIKHVELEIKNDWQKYMGVKDLDDVPPFIFTVNTDSSSDEEFGDEVDMLQIEDEEKVAEEEEIILMVVDDSE